MQNGDANLSLKSNLVAKADSFQPGRPLDRVMVTEKARKHLPEPLGGVGGVQLHVQGGWAGGGETKRVGHVQDLELKTGTVSTENKYDGLDNLFLNSIGPLLTGNAGQTGKSLNDDPVLLASVLDKVVDLGISGDLVADLLPESRMMIFDVGHPVLVMPNLLLNKGELRRTVEVDAGEQSVALVKKMQNEVKTGYGGEMAAIRKEILAGEAWQQLKVRG